MNVKVNIELIQSPSEHEEQQIYEVAQSLADDLDSIVITSSAKQPLAIMAEFTISKVRQIDVVDAIGRAFWIVDHYDTSTISFPEKRASRVPRRRRRITPLYTAKQGQYLAFIYYYSKIHRMAPAETDFQSYFRVAPSTVHRMIRQLEQRGLISRIPHQARSIQLLLPREKLPDLA